MIIPLILACMLYLTGGIMAALSTNGEINGWWFLLALVLTAWGFAVMYSSLRSVVM
jgi:hypothetical protein